MMRLMILNAPTDPMMTLRHRISPDLSHRFVACLLLSLGISMGCEVETPLPAETSSANGEAQEMSALQRLQAAGSAGDWEKAWTYSSEVMIHAADDQTALLSVAEVAFRTGRQVVAAELLAQAAKEDGYREMALVNRGVLGLVNVGRLFEAIELLEQAVNAHPDDMESRRVLFDLYVTTEQRRAAGDEAKTLIRRRAFDFELLTHTMIDFRRSLENESLEQMVQWNPDDPRALIGDARTQLDLSEFRLCIERCDEILASHRDFQPAIDLRFAAASALNDQETTRAMLDELVTLPSGAIAWSGWLLLGDFFAGQQQRQSAAACYWKAADQAADRPQVWTKLASVTDRDDVANRARQLIGLRQSEIEVGRTFRGEADAKVMQAFDDIANARLSIGQPWLAEAWAAFALTVPLERGVDGTKFRERLAATRGRIIGQLSQQTPWVIRSLIPLPNDPAVKAMAPADLLASVAQQLPDRDRPDPSLPSDSGLRPPAQPFVAHLINEASQRGLLYDEHSAKNLDQPGVLFYATLGCGGGTIDFDQDGWPDLYLVGAGGRPPQRDSASNALFRNLDGQFANVTLASQTTESDFGQGVTVGDLNQDGFEDFVCLNYGRDTCWINNGDGTFTDQTARWLPSADDGWSTSGAIADFNGDHIPDLFSLRYCEGLDPVRVACVDQSEPSQAHGGQAALSTDPNDITGHRACSPMVFKPAADQVHFGSREGGLVAPPDDEGLALPQYGRGLGLMVGPLDDQPGLDVFVANDMSSNHLWSYRNVSQVSSQDTVPPQPSLPIQGTWYETGLWRGLAGNGLSSPQGSMGVAAGDFDRDGGVDLYVTNFSAEYNTLHRKRGGVWDDHTAAMGLIVPTLSVTGFGTDAADMNRDGWSDLIVANGNVDHFLVDDNGGGMFQPLQIFSAVGDGRMQPAPMHPQSQYLNDDHIGRALWTIDADRDHQVDYVVTHQSEPVALLMNRIKPAGEFVEIELVGTRCERSAAGAVVEVRRGDWFARETMMVGDGYLCRNEPVLRFALPSIELRESETADQPVRVTVYWPDASQTSDQPVEINRRHKLVQ